jgi:Cdc6-like AAA superfamily ATPase
VPLGATPRNQNARIGQHVRIPVPTLFITGAPGSGKTAFAKEVSELLWQVDETSHREGRAETATAETDTGSAPMRGMPVIGS